MRLKRSSFLGTLCLISFLAYSQKNKDESVFKPLPNTANWPVRPASDVNSHLSEQSDVVIRPDNLSDRFNPRINQTSYFSQSTQIDDSKKKEILRMLYANEASHQLDLVIANYLLAIFSICLILTALMQKSSYSVVAAWSSGGMLLAYLLFGFTGGNLADIRLLVESTWPKGILIIAAVCAGTLLFLKMLRDSPSLVLSKRIIILIGVAASTILATSYLSNYVDGTILLLDGTKERDFFNLQEHRMNWACGIFVCLLFAFYLFGKQASKSEN